MCWVVYVQNHPLSAFRKHILAFYSTLRWLYAYLCYAQPSCPMGDTIRALARQFELLRLYGCRSKTQAVAVHFYPGVVRQV